MSNSDSTKQLQSIRDWSSRVGLTPVQEIAITEHIVDKKLEFAMLTDDEDIDAVSEQIFFLGMDLLTEAGIDLKDSPSPAGEGRGEGALDITHNDDIVNTEVVDEDGEVVTITQELRESFLMDHGKVEGAFWQVAFALAKIKNEKSYLAGGFTSFSEYISKAIPLERTQAYGYVLVGDKFRAYEDKILNGEAPTTQITKAKMIASQSQDEVRRLMEKGKIAWGEDTLTKEELENETITSLKARLKIAEEEREKAQEKSQKAELLEEKLKNAEMEKEELAEFHERNATRVQKAEAIEADIAAGHKAIADYQRIMTRICLEDAPEHLVKQYYDLLEVSKDIHQRFWERNMPYLADLDVPMPAWFDDDAAIKTHIE